MKLRLNQEDCAPQRAVVVPGYEIVGQIDDGLYKARQTRLGRPVLLRILADVGAGPASPDLEADIQAASRLNHPCFLRVIDGGQAEGRHFIVTEHVDGVTLQQVVDQLGALPVPVACACLLQVCRALEHAHPIGFVHQHIKPANLLMTAPMNTGLWHAGQVPPFDKWREHKLVVKLAQGPRQFHDVSAATPPPGVSVGFLAPEQLELSWRADPRADLYALGCTLYYLLCARLPFAGASRQETLDRVRWLPPRSVNLLRPEVPIALAELIRRLMAKNPAERFQSATETAAALAAFVPPGTGLAAPGTHEPVSQPVPTATTKSGTHELETPWALPGAGLCLSRPAPPAATSPLDARPWALDQRDKQEMPASADPPASNSGARRPPIDASALRARLAARPSTPAPAQAAAPAPVSATQETHFDLGKASSADTVSAPAPARPAEPTRVDQLRGLLANQIERSNYLEAQNTVAELLAQQLDETALSARQFLEDVVGAWAHFDKHTGPVNSIAFTPNGKLFVSGGQDKTVRVWELATGKQRHCLATEQPVLSVSTTADSRQVVGGAAGGFIHVWDLESGKETQRLRSYDGDVLSVAAAPVGHLLAAGNRRASAIIWDMTTGRGKRALAGHTGEVSCAVWSPTARWALTAGADGQVRLYGGEKFQPNGRIELVGRRVAHSAAFVGENMAVVGLSDGNLVLHSSSDFVELRRFTGHAGRVNSVAVSTDKQRILSGGADRTLRLWNAASAQELRVFEGHTDEVLSVALSADGSYALSASRDATVRLWKLPM